MKKMYNLNPFGYIKKRNKSLDEYINNVYLAANEAAGNLDYGVTYIISVQYRQIVLTFGMYRRMALMDNKWFQVIVPGIEFIVCWLCYFSVIRLWKKDKLELL